MTSADDLLDDLQWRGLIASSTDLGALRAAFDAGPVTFYSGVDPTAPSMHMGNLVQWVTARRLQQAGHRPLALIGGATGLIGDPSGKNSERVLNDSDVVAGWAQRIRDQVSRFIDFDGPAAATMVNNLDWTAKLSAIEWLRDIGKHFSVNRMIDKESVRARLHGDGISYTEFSYQVLQANDYLELHRQYGCTLQTGGNDQWGNITAGVDLVRRVTGRSVHALTTPLITKADGTKFGKTESGTVWLDPDMTSPYTFYQFLVNADDRDVITYLKVFSSRPREEIQTLEKAVTEQPSAREAQHALADELTALVHGPAHRDAVVAASLALFGRGSLTDLDGATLAAALGELPTTRVQLGPQHPLPTVVDLMAATGLSSSRSAARRAVEEGGAYLNNTRVLDADARPRPADLLGGRWLLLRRGKRTLAAVDVASETVS